VTNWRAERQAFAAVSLAQEAITSVDLCQEPLMLAVTLEPQMDGAHSAVVTLGHDHMPTRSIRHAPLPNNTPSRREAKQHWQNLLGAIDNLSQRTQDLCEDDEHRPVVYAALQQVIEKWGGALDKVHDQQCLMEAGQVVPARHVNSRLHAEVRHMNPIPKLVVTQQAKEKARARDQVKRAICGSLEAL
jgi:hypothetical protein